MNPSDIAYEAARLISEHGHCKEALTNTDGNYCIDGALRKAVGIPVKLNDLKIFITTDEEADAHQARAAVLSAASRIVQEQNPDMNLSVSIAPVITFNDDPSTTAEDVILLLKETAAALEGTQ